ncbi:TAXI family TRAP transporter solute-binding subunit [Sulfitobacter sp. AS92]|uniref:TAXI family TRAP transporter solute-binding subunit n=1 Tax=Sulfitobacter sp. AS92 TaxID=3135783 RepID=UPI003172E8E2
MKPFRMTLAAALLAITTGSGPALAETIKAEGGSAAGLSALVPQLLSKYAAADHNVRVNIDQTLTRAALKVATGSIDLAVMPAGAYDKMITGSGPYQNLKEQAIEASGNVRVLFSFLGGHVHAMTYADSGVETWEDLRGQRVFVGPPAGTFSSQTTGMIEAITGMKPGEDYEAIKLAWSAANQAFEDGKFDVFMRSGTIGSAAIDQFGSAKKFRLLSVPAESLETEAWVKYLAVPGRAADVLPAGTYQNQINNDEDVMASAFVMFVGVNVDMAEQTAYDLTKAMFDNIDNAHSVNQGLKPLTLENATVSLNARLHPGAIRYYEEQGLEIPAELR